MKSLSAAQKHLIANVTTLIKLILVMPATNATSERSFSAMRRLKNYLRMTMTQERLNNLMLMHVHKTKTDNLNLETIVNEFVSFKEQRFSFFGKF